MQVGVAMGAENYIVLRSVHDTLATVADILTTSENDALSFRWCQFSGQVKTSTGAPLQDSDVLQATYTLETSLDWVRNPPSSRRVYEAIQIAARREAIHPVKEYLQALKWDGIPRANKLLSHYLGGCDSQLRRTQSAAFLVGAVARIFVPGSKVDVMPVLISAQGTGKSTAIRELSVVPDWFRDTPLDLRSKDCYEAIQGAWIVEIAEMRSIVSTSAETVKAFLTSAIDSYRPAYGRCNVYRPRQCVFIGTSNDLQLTDTTGNRRYWPIPLESKPDLEAIRSDRDQLWAEAVVIFSRGDSWHLVAEDDIAAASEEAGDFSTQDPWIPEICDYWNSQHLANRRPFETTEILTYLGIDKRSQKQGHVMRVTRLMRGAGFTSKRKRDHGIRRTYWKGPTGHAGQAD